MRLADLTISELLALANILLRIAEDTPERDGAETLETVDEIKYILRLVSEKTAGGHAAFQANPLN
jgi:hypothetical protein